MAHIVRKYLLVFLFETAVVLPSMAQFSFKTDKHYNFRPDSLLMASGIDGPDFKKIDFEFRFSKLDVLGDYNAEIYIARHFKDSTWHLVHYQLCFDRDRQRYTIISRNDSLMQNWNNEWARLVSYHILTLPDGTVAQKMWATKSGFLYAVGDGIGYGFYLKTKKRKRSYFYSNPETLLEKYGDQFSELTNVNKIISQIKHDFGYRDENSCLCGN